MRRVFSLALTIGGAVLVLLVAALWSTVDHARESSRWVFHTYRVLESVDQLESAAMRLEAAQRGQLFSSDDRFARERDIAIEALDRSVAELLRQTSDNADQQERFRSLARQVEARVRIATANQVQGRGSPAARLAALDSPEARQAAAGINATIAAIKAEELQLLQQRRLNEVEFQRRTLAVMMMAMAGGALLIAVVFWGYRRQLQLNQRAESRFRDLVQALPVSLWRLRGQPGDLKFEFISDNAHAIRQIDPHASRKDCSQVQRNIHPDDLPAVDAALHQCAQTLGPLDLKYRIRDRAGRLRWIQSGAALRTDTDGSLLWSGYWADITEEVELKQALQAATHAANQANAAKSAFLAAVSHEIRTPMNGVLGLLELLSLSQLDTEQQSTLSVVRDSGRALLRIVDDILDFSKIEANKMSLHPVPASVALVVDTACRIHSSLGSGKGLLLQARVDPRINPALMFDPQRLGQVLSNLVSNALKFTERGSVTIEALWLGRSEDGEEVAFVVTDTGIGISQDDMARLFQPFVQSGGQTAARFGGTGLGLVISRRLVEMMGGRIAMESEPGRGTTMRVHCTFPLAQDSQLAPGIDAALSGVKPALQGAGLPLRAPPSLAEAERDGTLILVVDDHPTNRMVLRRQVNSLGYAAETAADGRIAYEAWKSGRFGLVLADCNMPEMNGYELARAIRRDEQAQGLPRTPVLACTANALASQASACEDAGMDAWMVKPCGLRELNRHLERWLPHPAALPGPQEPQEPPIDAGLLDAVTLGSDELKAEILAEFRRTNEDDALLLRGAVAEADLDAVLALSHRIKGACLAVGAQPLADACRRVEDSVRADDRSALPSLMALFERRLAQLSAQLDANATGSIGAALSD